MHEVYKLYPVLKQGVQVECITAFDNNVILGTRNGQLIMYSVDENGLMDMLMFHKSFSKKTITQVEVAAMEQLLFVLTDGQLFVCDISGLEGNFTTLHLTPYVKGCTLFTLNVESTQSTTGVSVTLIRVACTMKRRLHCYYWNRKQKVLASPNFYIELKDTPKCLCWFNDLICVGYKDEYIVYNIQGKSTEKYDLVDITIGYNMDPCICLLKDDILAVTNNDSVLTFNVNNYRSDRDKLTQLQRSGNRLNYPEDENRYQSMKWSNALTGLAWDEPFLLGCLENGVVEIRYLDTYDLSKPMLLQTFNELNRIKFLVRAQTGVIFVAGGSELWCLRRIPIPIQRQKLLEQKMFQVAIDLTKISNESKETKEDLVRQIHMRYAKELFNMKQFSAAMREYSNANANPHDVIRLYPALMPDKNPMISPQTTIDGSTIINTTTTTTNNNNNGVCEVPAIPIETQLEGEDLKNSIEALIQYLTQARQKEVVKMLETKINSSDLLSIIDTTLLKCYLQTKESLIAPLLRLNQCHFEQSEAALLKYGKIAELIILYQNNSCHRKALQLLQKEALIKDSPLFGWEKSIQYLQQLGANNLPLILEFSDWILNQNPEEGLRIFTEEFIEVENLPRAQILDFLLEKHKGLVLPYLEHVIHVWKDSKTQLHNILIQQYVDRFVKQQLLTTDDKEIMNEKQFNQEQLQLKSKLNKLLANCPNYTPEVVITYLTNPGLLEERALVLGRLEQHEDVLIIYVQIMGDMKRAKEYCEVTYAHDSMIFVKLVKLLLCPLTQSPYKGVQLHKDFLKPKETVLLDLLNTYPSKIDPMEIWQHLPKDISLKKLYNYLETVLRTQIGEQHHLEIKRSLLESELVRLERLINEQKNIHFEINETTVCPECRKRFTAQGAFVHYPSGEIVHLSCYDKRVMATNLFGV